MNKILNIKKLNEEELKMKVKPSGSWHRDYQTPWIYIGNVNSEILNEELLVLFSQYGEPVHLERDMDKKFGFLKYQLNDSAVLAIDNINGVEFKNTILNVDHAKSREINSNPLFSLNGYDMCTCDKFISIMKEFGGNCAPELFAYRDFVNGSIKYDPLEIRPSRRNKEKKRKLRDKDTMGEQGKKRKKISKLKFKDSK
eukprot:NODE_936_length_2941_cov_0.552428.p1 type:complete len:198 gc:universal NODE_936_length_2941_cov_0.552428:953-1546(+)